MGLTKKKLPKKINPFASKPTNYRYTSNLITAGMLLSKTNVFANVYKVKTRQKTEEYFAIDMPVQSNIQFKYNAFCHMY